jgi:uncharacterized membrane protein
MELSAMWRNPDVIGRVMQPLGEVQILGTDHLLYKFNLAGKQVQVECILSEERAGELVHRKSLPAAGFRLDERMGFKPAPQGRGTEATLAYDVDRSDVTTGATLASLASLFEGAADVAIRKVLHNFKSLAETGEIPTLKHNPSARGGKSSDGDLI